MEYEKIVGMRCRSSLLTFLVLTGSLLLCAFHAAPLRAQLTLAKPGEALPSFEVATVKPNNTGTRRARFMISPGMFNVENLSLRQIVLHAWGAKANAQLTGGPDALLDQHWDIEGKIDPADAARMKNMPREDNDRTIDLMLQALLADRFGLKVHIDTRELPVYELEVAKGGPKLTRSAPPPPRPADGQGPMAPPPGDAKPGADFRGMRMTANGSTLDVTARGASMEFLASMLARRPETESRLVLDKTGLTGDYDFTLHFAAENMSAAGDAGASDSGAADSPPLFTALEEQLGLKLEPAKAEVQIVAIDHVEPPTPN
jgi:uncharacterized protein (TIGR03435 family)